MRLSLTSCCVLLSSLLLVPSLALPAALSVNGTCELGSCASPDSISYPTVIPTTPFNFTYTVGSDTYALTGTYTTGYTDSGSNIGITLSAVYTGSAPSTAADTINVHLLQNIFDDSAGSFDGAYSEHIPVKVGAGSMFTGQLSFDGQGIGTIGPLSAGTYDITKTANLTGLDGNTLSADYNLIFAFAAGTAPGTGTSVLSSVPEPTQTIPIAFGLVVFGLGAFRRKQAKKA